VVFPNLGFSKSFEESGFSLYACVTLKESISGERVEGSPDEF
jgi:hypothetical protein